MARVPRPTRQDTPPGEKDEILAPGGQPQHVVIIDDQATGRTILERVVQNISSTITQSSYADPHEALEACRKRPPDLLITDYRMPILNGIEVIRQFRQIPGCERTPTVVVTIVEDKKIRYEALEAGATDFLNRPFDHYECQARCRNLLLLHQYQQEADQRARNLESQVAFATQQIKRREHETLFCLAKAGEFRDEGTGNHIQRIARYSLVIAQALGLQAQTLDELEYASPMHDIGKIGIPDAILLKPGKLTPDEWEIMKQHTIIGYDILAKSNSPYLQMAASIALSHHERWDGSGYPNGLTRDEIPMESRIVAVADTLDALTTVRPYKQAWTLEDSIEHIGKHAGKHFDPACVEAFFSQKETIEEI
ncbi:MAG TPA: response regulator, partial [Chromatiaceae bacterium]|nr:response regulator [Chromatiaceae bacterium]